MHSVLAYMTAVYCAASKADAERRVLDALPEALVVRTSAFFGPWDEHNLVTRGLNALAAGESFPVASDATVSPTFVPDLVHTSLDLLIDGGECSVGIESTIVDVSGPRPVQLRPGGISTAALEAALGQPLSKPDAAAPRAPGTLRAHYAPSKPLMLVEPDLAPELVRTLARQERKLAVLSFTALRNNPQPPSSSGSARHHTHSDACPRTFARAGAILGCDGAHMHREREFLERGMHVQAVAKFLERIGDHVTNLAELVIFLVKGKDVRHGKLDRGREAEIGRRHGMASLAGTRARWWRRALVTWRRAPCADRARRGARRRCS